MKFTVFGSAGFIGSHLASYLLSEGHDVFCPEREYVINKEDNLGCAIYCIGLTADFRERPFDTMEAHIGKLGQVLQTAVFESLTYLSSTRLYIHNGADTTENALIPVSVTDPFDLFNASKLAGEFLALYGGRKNIRIARISNIYGDDFTSKNFITSIATDAVRHGKIVLRTTPGSAKDYLSIEDTVRLLYNISAFANDSVYNVASGRNVTNGAILEAIQRETGCEIEYAATAEEIVFSPINIEKAKNEFNFSPTSSIVDSIPGIIRGLKKTILHGSPNES